MAVEPEPSHQVALTDFDLALFRALQQDGRVSYPALASRFQVSEAHVRRRVRALLDQDVFAIAAVADPRLLGIEWMALIGLRASLVQTRHVAETLASLREVNYVVITSGAFNAMCEVGCRTADDLYRLLHDIRTIDGVQRTETFVYLQILRQQFTWTGVATGDPGHAVLAKQASTLGDGRELDRLDVELVRELERDGRASFRQLGRRLGISERATSARLNRLVTAGLIAVIAVGNPSTLGFNDMAFLGITLADGADLDALVTSLGEIPQVSYLLSVSGRYELLAEIVCQNRPHLLATLGRIGAAPGVGHVDTYYYLQLLYQSSAGCWGAGRQLSAVP
jgi:DNA-binding Lrp family transcriptional regulator